MQSKWNIPLPMQALSHLPSNNYRLIIFLQFKNPSNMCFAICLPARDTRQTLQIISWLKEFNIITALSPPFSFHQRLVSLLWYVTWCVRYRCRVDLKLKSLCQHDVPIPRGLIDTEISRFLDWSWSNFFKNTGYVFFFFFSFCQKSSRHSEGLVIVKCGNIT